MVSYLILHWRVARQQKRECRIGLHQFRRSHLHWDDWAGGRLVFTDTGTVGTIDGTDTVLRVSGALTGNTLTSSDFTNTVTYAGTGVVAGFSSGTTGAFTLCRSGYIGRIISISVTGRVSTDKTGSNCP